MYSRSLLNHKRTILNFVSDSSQISISLGSVTGILLISFVPVIFAWFFDPWFFALTSICIWVRCVLFWTLQVCSGLERSSLVPQFEVLTFSAGSIYGQAGLATGVSSWARPLPVLWGKGMAVLCDGPVWWACSNRTTGWPPWLGKAACCALQTGGATNGAPQSSVFGWYCRLCSWPRWCHYTLWLGRATGWAPSCSCSGVVSVYAP